MPSVDDARHRFAAHDEIAERQRALDLLLDAIDLAGERFDFQRALDRNLEPFGRGGLDDEVDGTTAHGVDRRLDGTVRRLHDNRRHAWNVADAIENRHSVDARHDEVEQHERDQIAVLAFEDLKGLLSRSAVPGFETEALDRLFEQTPLNRIVIDDQNTLGHVIRNFTFTEAVQAISKLN